MRKRKERLPIQEVVLATVKTAGTIGVALVAPNALQLIRAFGHEPHKRQSEVIRSTQKDLVKRGWLAYDKGFIKLTHRGEKELHALELKNYEIKKPRRWDGKWRVLIFDIAEYRRKTRDQLRHTLKRVGFVHVQDSVWLYPYDCQELVSLLKADFKIGKAMLYMVVDELEGDRYLREHFNLLH